MFGDDGRKMSKSYQNYPDPKDVLEEKGAEAVRLYLMSTPIMAGGDTAWSSEILNDAIKDVLIPIWNTYRYLSLYANIHNWSPATTEFTSEYRLDKWIESYMKQTALEYSKALEAYDIPSSVKLIQPCIDNISKWWIRRSRDRFSDGSDDALQTLYATLVLFTKTFAPQMPFLTEEMYQNLVVQAAVNGAKESVHLEFYPEVDEKEIDLELLEDMKVVRSICSNGLKIREDESLKLRQPLSKAYTSIEDKFLQEIIKAELNVKEIEKSEKPVEGENLVTNGNFEEFVTLDTEITDELLSEGYINDFLRQYQNARKKGENIDYGDPVILNVGVEDNKMKEILEKYLEENHKQLDIEKFTFESGINEKSFKLGDVEVSVEVEKV
jgi:isoleucyl-tRNA synthetase